MIFYAGKTKNCVSRFKNHVHNFGHDIKMYIDSIHDDWYSCGAREESVIKNLCNLGFPMENKIHNPLLKCVKVPLVIYVLPSEIEAVGGLLEARRIILEAIKEEASKIIL